MRVPVLATLIVCLALPLPGEAAARTPGETLVAMFEWWNEAYRDPEGFTPEAFARHFTQDAVMVINGNARGPGPAELARHFRTIQDRTEEVEIVLPFREAFDEGGRSFTYHYVRGRVNGQESWSRVMGYALVRGGRIALLDFVNLPIEGEPPAGVEANPADGGLMRELDALFAELLAASPMLASRLDRGGVSSAWDRHSAAARQDERELLERRLARLETLIEADALSPRIGLQYRIAVEELRMRLARLDWWAQNYPLNQIVGLHLDVPGILVNHHPVETLEQAEAYVQRLHSVEPLMTEFVEDLRLREEAGVLMPRAVYPRLIEATRQLLSGAPLDEGAEHPVWADFQRKLGALALPPDLHATLLAEGRDALLGSFSRGYRLLLTRLEDEATRTAVDGGVWQLPDGDAYYRFLLGLFTTTAITPAEVHELGLTEVARIQAEISALMHEVGFEGSLQAFFEHVRGDPRFYLADDDEGRAAYLALARKLVDSATARMGEVVGAAPSAPAQVLRFPSYREPGAPAGFYEAPAADGSRPGTIYLNLANMASNPLYALDALLYHEGPPGHHLQISTMQQDPGIPELRKVYVWWLNTAFIEGWALYAELLASELGLYRDPYSEFGRLSAELWRAARLVVDSGLHYKRWSRDEALEYMARNLPSSAEANAREVDRYLAVPGQATSFKIGMQRLLDLREHARETLGEDFDLSAFHDRVLSLGNAPLWAIEAAVEQWLAEAVALPRDAARTLP